MEHLAFLVSAFFKVCLLVFCLEKGLIILDKFKTYSCILLTYFQPRVYSYNILKIRRFQQQYFYKIYPGKKRKSIVLGPHP